MSDGCPFIACWVSVSNFRDAVKRTGAIFTERERRIVTLPNRAETETRGGSPTPFHGLSSQQRVLDSKLCLTRTCNRSI